VNGQLHASATLTPLKGA